MESFLRWLGCVGCLWNSFDTLLFVVTIPQNHYRNLWCLSVNDLKGPHKSRHFNLLNVVESSRAPFSCELQSILYLFLYSLSSVPRVSDVTLFPDCCPNHPRSVVKFLAFFKPFLRTPHFPSNHRFSCLYFGQLTTIDGLTNWEHLRKLKRRYLGLFISPFPLIWILMPVSSLFAAIVKTLYISWQLFFVP